MKGLCRILEKSVIDAQGGRQVPSIFDAARSMLIFNAIADIALCLERVGVDRTVKVLRLKDRFVKPAGGWSDILINLQFTSVAFVFEIQLVHKKMLVIRHDLGGHHTYDSYRVGKAL